MFSFNPLRALPSTLSAGCGRLYWSRGHQSAWLHGTDDRGFECPKGVRRTFFWHLYQKRRSLTKLEKPLLTEPKKKNENGDLTKSLLKFSFLFWPTNEKKLTLPTNEKKLTLARQLWWVYKIPPEKSKNGDLTKSLLKYFFLFWPTNEKKLTWPTNEKKTTLATICTLTKALLKSCYIKKKLTLENQPKTSGGRRTPRVNAFVEQWRSIVSKWSQEIIIFVAHKNSQYAYTYGTQILINVNFSISDIQKIACVV